MPPPVPEQLSRTIETLYRSESGRVLATLVRLLGDLDLAEEAMHEAFATALESWPKTGIPEKPRPWLISTARFKAIDGLRRRARFEAKQKDIALGIELQAKESQTIESQIRESQINEARGIEAKTHQAFLGVEKMDDEEIEDDRLRLIFTCCHPALPAEGQVALTLREICGLTTEEIARAFLVTPATLAQRIVRAKAVIRDKAIPYQVPAGQELSERLGAVLLVVYLIFNEGYSTTDAELSPPLSKEAIRLGRLLLDLLKLLSIDATEVMGLLGLMLLQESRRAARTTPQGDLILLEQQDRRLWNKEQIAEGLALTETALRSRRFGAYTLQAAIAAVHAESESPAATDWRDIKLLYDRLLRIQPSPVVELNRAVAVAMSEGPEQGLHLIDDLLAREQGVHANLGNYHLAHAARADLCRRLGRIAEARASYQKALALISTGKDRQEKDRREPERRFLKRRIEELGSGTCGE
ncbi:MAG TPA: RNA polymerase sigma factor [Candidatus Angelobacter sp.]